MMNACTIIICTHNGDSKLKRLFDSFHRSYNGFPCDLLVVDNSSTDQTPGVCAEAGVRTVYEPKLGLSVARNTGLAETRGDIIIYIDDDVTVRSGWLENLLEPFRQNDVAVVGGELDPVWEIPRPRWLTDRWIQNYSVCLRWSKTSRDISEGEWLCEANLAFRRKPLEVAGGFPTTLGRVGPALLSGDSIIIDAIRQAGGRAIFAPKAIIDHHISRSRLTPKWLQRRVFWQGITQSKVETYLIEQLGRADMLQEWRDLRLPIGHQRWAKILNAHPDSEFDAVLHECYDLGYALHKTGLMGI